MSERPTGGPKLRWEDDFLEDIRSMNVCNWKNVTQNRDTRKRVVEQNQNLKLVVAVYKKYMDLQPAGRQVLLRGQRPHLYVNYEYR